jgi:serine/threonine-protein kinase RsbW
MHAALIVRNRLGGPVVGLALALALAIASVATAWLVWDRGERVARQENARLAEQGRSAVLRSLGGVLTSLSGAAGIADRRGAVDPARFRAFAAAVRSNRGITTLELAPVVAAADRASFESAGRRVISDLVAPGVFRPAPTRGTHLPIAFVWPETRQNRRLLGLDLLSEPVRARAARRARDTREATFTRLVPLSVEGDGLLAFQPLFPRTGDAEPGAYVVAVLSRSIVSDVLGGLPTDARLRVELDGAVAHETTEAPSGGATRTATVGGRSLAVVASGDGASHVASGLILGIGLVLSWLLCAFLWARTSFEGRLRRAHGAERDARRRAELLESHAAGIAAATTPLEVAEATVADLVASGFDLVGVFGRRGGTIDVLATSGIPEETVSRMQGQPVGAEFAVAEAIRTGEVVQFDRGDAYDERFPAFADVRRINALESLVALPLRSADDRVIGALFAGAFEPAWVDDDRRLVLAGVAQQCGLALERAQLQAAIESTAETTAFLALLSDRLERSTSARRRAQRLVELLVAERASFAAVHVHDREPPLLAAAGIWPEDVDEATLAARVAAGSRAPTVGPLVLPLRAHGREIGALTIEPAATADAEPLDDVLAREIASRSAVALDNALLYERERNVSHELQLGLLGEVRLDVDSVLVAAAYRPGTETLEVGGDWYDAFRLPSRALALVVGDVVGHGLEAAVAMGQLRGAVRALGPTGSPARVLERLDTFVDSLPAGEMATVAYVELDPSTGALRYACAGHPPPLVVTASGPTRFLWEGRSAPLGSMLGHERREASDRLGEGETLLLFTDGLVERRGESLDHRLDQLAAAAADHPRGATALVHHVCDVLLEDENQDDDVCVLMLYRLPAPTVFEHSFAASPSQLADLRRRMSAWLRDAAVDEEVERAAVLAVSEAAANAVEHAYGSDGRSVVSVGAHMDSDGALHLEVRDRGAWREPRSGTDRGRGTPIMRAVMDEVVVERDGVGTVVRMRRSRAGDGR